jgi:hypothetical protein
MNQSTPAHHPPGARYCTQCGTVAVPNSVVRGSFLVEILCFMCFCLPGIIYSGWRATSRHDECSSCGSENVVPLNSPKAREALGTLGIALRRIV